MYRNWSIVVENGPILNISDISKLTLHCLRYAEPSLLVFFLN